MQPIARVAQHLLHPAAIKAFQALAELLADEISRWPLLTGLQFVVLMNVVMLQSPECCCRIVQASRRQAPRAYRRTHQMHWMRGLRQPLAEQKSV